MASRQGLAMVRVVLPTSVCGLRFRVTSRVSFRDRQGVRIRAKTRANGSEPCCASLFTDRHSINAGPVPWNYSSSAGSVPVETLVEATSEKAGAQAERAIAKALLTIQEDTHKRAQEANPTDVDGSGGHPRRGVVGDRLVGVNPVVRSRVILGVRPVTEPVPDSRT